MFLFILAGCYDGGMHVVSDDYTKIDYHDYISETDKEWGELVISSPLRIKPVLENNVYMIVIPDSVNENELVVGIYNNSQYLLVAGLHFSIEYFNGIDWMRVPWCGFPPPFDDVGIDISPGDSTNLTKNMRLFEPLIPGLYRVRKSVFIDGSVIGYVHDITAEFCWE